MFLICFTAYWFTPTTQSALICILAFMIGTSIGNYCPIPTTTLNYNI